MSEWVVYIDGQPFARINDQVTAEEYADIWRCSLAWEGDKREATVGEIEELENIA